jgi:Ca2+-binding RTX toxin-like protein
MDNRIRIEFNAATSDYVVSDTTGIDDRSQCHLIGPTTATCALTPPAEIQFDTYAGNDSVILSSALPTGEITGYASHGDDVVKLESGSESPARLFGGHGSDRLIGASGNDALIGHSQNDTLSSGSGNDVVTGGRGSDTLIGGKGDDVLRAGAQDRGADRAIRCGAGDDLARVDKADPAPVRCERVIRR